jgi:hypothetical protein
MHAAARNLSQPPDWSVRQRRQRGARDRELTKSQALEVGARLAQSVTGDYPPADARPRRKARCCVAARR